MFPEGLGELTWSLCYRWQRPFPSSAMGLKSLNQIYSKELLWTSTPSLSPQSSIPTAPGKPCPKPPAHRDQRISPHCSKQCYQPARLIWQKVAAKSKNKRPQILLLLSAVSLLLQPRALSR